MLNEILEEQKERNRLCQRYFTEKIFGTLVDGM